MVLEKPGGITIGRERLSCDRTTGRRHGWFLGDEEMERQRREGAGWGNQQVALALDQTFNRPKEQPVKLVSGRKIEQCPLASCRGLCDVVDLKAATERGNLVGQCFGIKSDRRPAEAVASECKHIGFVIARLDEDERLVGPQQCLPFLRLEWLGALDVGGDEGE